MVEMEVESRWKERQKWIELFCWMVGWLVGWFVGWLVGWFVGWWMYGLSIESIESICKQADDKESFKSFSLKRRRHDMAWHDLTWHYTTYRWWREWRSWSRGRRQKKEAAFCHFRFWRQNDREWGKKFRRRNRWKSRFQSRQHQNDRARPVKNKSNS